MTISSDCTKVYIGSPPPQVNRLETISQSTGWTPIGGRIRSYRNPNRNKTDINIQDKTLETHSGRRFRVMSPLPIGIDTFLDDEVGDTVRNIKENFGDAPLINAYEAALNISKESNKKWKEYWEEETRLQSLFEED